ncbi:MAG: bifunctional tetrahydrofolate synthase/dihydrofolate synthase [Betaproteobacteria bacterium]|nr:bifunctional tetrahydrofolate synthase/dihydrofolate synthase [Betaproteobacteria bacterium]
MNPNPETLGQWLEYIERLHPKTIALGLERVSRVREALGLRPAFPLITVGGTNGKGSACAMLEAILHHAGYKVGCYTSPHLLRYNERVRIARVEAGDRDLVRSFEAVERARRSAEVQLTYFEFGTLAAMWLFVEQGLDAAVLEVGLGGRLDAVNAFDTDCAVVTRIAIDHVDFLGADREAIGYEKAGIFRSKRPAICADPEPPSRLVDHARELGAPLLLIGADFFAQPQGPHWQYRGPDGKRSTLPHPALRGAFQLANAAAAITALGCLREKLPVAMNDIRSGLLLAESTGRFQVLPGRPAVVLDVAHNPDAACALAANLSAMPCAGRTLAVFSVLNDKDLPGIIEAVKAHIHHWFVGGIRTPRGRSGGELHAALTAAGVERVTECRSVAEAYTQACDMAAENDRILAFGSFYAVAAVLAGRAAPAAGVATAGKRETPGP